MCLHSVSSVLPIQLLSTHISAEEKRKSLKCISWLSFTVYNYCCKRGSMLLNLSLHIYFFNLNTAHVLGSILLCSVFSCNFWYGKWLSHYFSWPEMLHNLKVWKTLVCWIHFVYVFQFLIFFIFCCVVSDYVISWVMCNFMNCMTILIAKYAELILVITYSICCTCSSLSYCQFTDQRIWLFLLLK
jgi:hypothetical protein